MSTKFLYNRPRAAARSVVFVIGLMALIAGTIVIAAPRLRILLMGRQPDGSFLVSTGQRIEGDGVAFNGRPSDIALHPMDNVMAVLGQHDVFICSPTGVLARSRTPLGDASAGYHGILWTGDRRGSGWWPNAMQFVVSTDQGYLEQFSFSDLQLEQQGKIPLAAPGDQRNAWPGGMCITKDRRTVFVAAAGLDSVVEVDVAGLKRVRDYPAQTLPYEVQLSADEKTLIVTNWGGRKPATGDIVGKSADEDIVTDSRGILLDWDRFLIDRATGETTNIDVGIHPTAIAVSGDKAYVANAMSDTISEIDVPTKKVTRTLSVRWGALDYPGAMPNALAIRGNRLYVCNGGDNALCEVDIPSGKVLGFRHAGYYPSAVQVSHDGRYAYVMNTKGNGSVGNTSVGNPGSPHDFVGTISVIDLTKDLSKETALVARDNHWNIDPNRDRPKLAVYNGAIKHVIYVIKENQTYDLIFGAMPEGNGAPNLCVLGQKVMPNHWALAREFTLFDNSYVSGTNSADGHAWSTQSMANDYMEHMYVSYRTYSDDGDCAMSRSIGGCLWDAAAARGKSVRVYGEFCDEDLATYLPAKPKDWFEAYDDYKSGAHKFTYHAQTQCVGLKPFLCPTVHYWPLIQSDQSRVDAFVSEYNHYVATDSLPDLSIICLPCDHSEGMNQDYPTPRAMRADNDLALGRLVDAVSHGPHWKDTCIFVIEDDGQALPDHVDGHRVPYMVISPYNMRHVVDSHFYTTASMLRSIGLMLGFGPMTRFDACSEPITTCFTDTPDLTPFTHVPNQIPLDERNPPPAQMTATGRFYYRKSCALDWSHGDDADPYWLSRITWYSLTGGSRPFPAEPGEAAERGPLMADRPASRSKRVAGLSSDRPDM